MQHSRLSHQALQTVAMELLPRCHHHNGSTGLVEQPLDCADVPRLTRYFSLAEA